MRIKLHFKTAMGVIVATAVLHNIAVEINQTIGFIITIMVTKMTRLLIMKMTEVMG